MRRILALIVLMLCMGAFPASPASPSLPQASSGSFRREERIRRRGSEQTSWTTPSSALGNGRLAAAAPRRADAGLRLRGGGTAEGEDEEINKARQLLEKAAQGFSAAVSPPFPHSGPSPPVLPRFSIIQGLKRVRPLSGQDVAGHEGHGA